MVRNKHDRSKEGKKAYYVVEQPVIVQKGRKGAQPITFPSTFPNLAGIKLRKPKRRVKR